jgi:heterodisulfide reductase subunit B
MKLAFYPGCSLEGMANDYARSTLAVFNHLDITLGENGSAGWFRMHIADPVPLLRAKDLLR